MKNHHPKYPMKLIRFLSCFCLTFILVAPGLAQADEAVDALIKQGDVHDQKLEPKEALGFYLAAEKIQPENVSLLLSIARQYRHQAADAPSIAEKMKLSHTGKDYAKRALALAPNESEAHLSVAISHAKMVPILDNKEKVEASRQVRASVDKAIELDASKDLAWHVLGGWHQRLAELGTVKRAMARMLYGELPAASNEEAVKCFQQAIKLNPDRLIHHIELGRTYAQMGRTEEARKCIEKGLAMPNVGKDDPEIKQRGRDTLAALK
jgi:tetratricopeptide (TPR) repeat protein